MGFDEEGKEVYHAGLELATSPKHSPAQQAAMAAVAPQHHPQHPPPMMQESGTYPSAPPMSAYPYDQSQQTAYQTYSPVMDQRTLSGQPGALGGAAGAYHAAGAGTIRREPRILGFRPATFFLSLALLVAIVIAAVGGGVGGSIAVQNARRDGIAEGFAQAIANGSAGAGATGSDSAPTVTVTESASAPTKSSDSSSDSTAGNQAIDVPTKGKLKLDCPKIDGTKQIINVRQRSYTFDVTCGIDFNGEGLDIASIVSYSLHDCMQACAMYNFKYGSASPCIAAAFNNDLTGSVAKNYGTCFIKNSTGQTNQKSKTDNVGVRLVATK